MIRVRKDKPNGTENLWFHWHSMFLLLQHTRPILSIVLGKFILKDLSLSPIYFNWLLKCMYNWFLITDLFFTIITISRKSQSQMSEKVTLKTSPKFFISSLVQGEREKKSLCAFSLSTFHPSHTHNKLNFVHSIF